MFIDLFDILVISSTQTYYKFKNKNDFNYYILNILICLLMALVYFLEQAVIQLD